MGHSATWDEDVQGSWEWPGRGGPRQAWRLFAAARTHGRHGGPFGPGGPGGFGGGGPGGGFGGWGGPFGRGGFGRGPKVGRGDVRAAILVLLTEGPMHGYQVIQELTDRSGGMWRPSPGSVYPTLQLLEDEGLVRSEEVDGKRVFHLTAAGAAEAAKRREGSATPWEVGAGGESFFELRNLGFGVVAAVMQVVQTGDEALIAKAMDILAATKRSIYLLLAGDEGRAPAASAPGSPEPEPPPAPAQGS